MYSFSKELEIPIAISEKRRDVLPVLYGSNYKVTVRCYFSEEAEEDIEAKLAEEIDFYFSQYDHSMILEENNPLVSLYRENFKEHSIDIDNTRLFIWEKEPTVRYMAYRWYSDLRDIFIGVISTLNIKFNITVEETAHNKITYEE